MVAQVGRQDLYKVPVCLKNYRVNLCKDRRIFPRDLQQTMFSPPKASAVYYCSLLGSVMVPEPDFFAGAEAGEKEPAPACCYVI